MDFDPNYLLASMLVSGIGFVLYKYGRKQRRPPHIGVGALMFVYPYFVTDVAPMLGITLLLLALLWASVRFFNV